MLPALMCGEEEALIETIKKSHTQARMKRARVSMQQYIGRLKGLSDGPRYIPVEALRNDLTEEMKADGTLRDNDVLKTRKVTDALKLLGFESDQEDGP